MLNLGKRCICVLPKRTRKTKGLKGKGVDRATWKLGEGSVAKVLVSTHEDSRSDPRIPCQVGVADSLYPSLGRQRLAMSPNSEF